MMWRLYCQDDPTLTIIAHPGKPTVSEVFTRPVLGREEERKRKKKGKIHMYIRKLTVSTSRMVQ
jgi:hypothetical protein